METYSRLQSLQDYIDQYYDGRQKAFAAAAGVKPQQVTQWLGKGFSVADHTLYSPRRALPLPTGEGGGV